MKFYSETLDKLFDTEDALNEAECMAKKAAEEKAKKAEAKKAEAHAVEAAFKTRNEARRTYNANVLSLRKDYNKQLVDLRKSFEESVEAEAKKLSTAENVYDTALQNFIDKHPEGYHLTLKDGDNVTTLDGNTGRLQAFANDSAIERLFNNEKLFNDLFDSFFKL